MKLFYLLLLLSPLNAALPSFFPLITPPKEWEITAPSEQDPAVKIGFVQSSKKFFSPSMTFAMETVGDATLATYLQAVKQHYTQEQGNTYRYLGYINTSIGPASLIQIDTQNQWGKIRILQAISIYQGYALIQTGVCLKDDFIQVHETLLDAFSKIHVYASIFESIDAVEFGHKTQTLITAWNAYQETSSEPPLSLFCSLDFQNKLWIPYVTYIKNELANKGTSWQFLAINHIKESLLETNHESK